MTKRGRPATTFHLQTCNDPALWKYASLQAALRASMDELAAAIVSQAPTETTTPSCNSNVECEPVADDERQIVRQYSGE